MFDYVRLNGRIIAHRLIIMMKMCIRDRNDCVGTSMRHGAKSVLKLEMMPKAPDERTEMNPWPEWPRVCKTCLLYTSRCV